LDKHDQQRDADEPEAAAGELARQCNLCHADIPAEFFTLRGLVVCPGCAEKVRQRQSGRGNTRRALLYGAAAAAATTLLWLLASAATSRELAVLAIPAGFAIGLSVHQGSGGRGGIRHQLAAMLLVYATFVSRFVPPIFGGIADAIKKEHATASLADSKARESTRPSVASPSADTAPAAIPSISPPTSPLETDSQTSLLATLKAYFVFTAVAWGLVLASPFMPTTTNVLSLLSLAVGMAFAFRLNRRLRLCGPFAT
jgi:hypothetical protein